MRNISAMLFLSLIMSPPAFSDHAADEEAVWSLEENYWTYVKNNDLSGYLTLWDEEFVGWPSFSEIPFGKENISDWIPPLHENASESYDYELTREAVRSFGDVVVVHYLYRHIFRSAETGEILRSGTAGRITHTWQRRGDTWQIITGMSAGWIGNDNEQ